MGLFDRIHAKIELFRLEQRYTRRRHRRSTFQSNAIYVDGEYIYQTPDATGSSYHSSSSSSDNNSSSATTPIAEEEPAFESSYSSHNPAPMEASAAKQRKKMHRFSSMPGFGSSTASRDVAPASNWRTQRNSFDGTR